jgi:hydrogenase/urease accessory protein HupE
MIARRVVLVLVALCALLAGPERASAHALEPGFLELTPLGGDDWRVTWRKPQVNGRPMAIDAVLPQGCSPRRGPEPTFDGRAFIAGWVAQCPGGLGGGEITIDGLDRTRTDVLVRYALAPDRAAQTTRLTSLAPSFTMTLDPSRWGIFTSYVALGTDHILTGFDHLIFVFALLLLIRDWRKLLATVTCFTLGHSLSLAAASLGWIVVPGPPVEAAIALSIMFLAAELVRPTDGQTHLAERYPWAVALAFGLLHGLGFARALVEIGLPEGEVPLALVSFNLGVEAGQLLFIGMVIGIAAILARLFPMDFARLMAPGGRGVQVLSYAIGGIAAFWLVERVAGFVV